MNDEIPLSIGGGIGQSRTYMYLLRKAHLGEVSVTVWPQDPQGHVRRTEYLRSRVGEALPVEPVLMRLGDPELCGLGDEEEAAEWHRGCAV